MGPQRSPGGPRGPRGPRRSGPSLDRTLGRFTFGGRLPGGVGLVIAITVIMSVLTALGGHRFEEIFEAMALMPERVLHGEVWRLFTWAFVEHSPFTLIFACLALWWFGGPLANLWGSRRFFLVYMIITGIAAVGTTLMALVDRSLYDHAYLGNGATAAAVTIAWGLLHPNSVIRIYFIIPIRGIIFAWGTVVITLLVAIYYGWGVVMPYLFTEASMLAWLYRAPAVRWWHKRSAERAEARVKAERRARVKKAAEGRIASVVVLHKLQDRDDDDGPLDEEAEAKLKELFGKDASKDKKDLN